MSDADIPFLQIHPQTGDIPILLVCIHIIIIIIISVYKRRVSSTTLYLYMRLSMASLQKDTVYMRAGKGAPSPISRTVCDRCQKKNRLPDKLTLGDKIFI